MKTFAAAKSRQSAALSPVGERAKTSTGQNAFADMPARRCNTVIALVQALF
jgi:hypothetical protein